MTNNEIIAEFMDMPDCVDLNTFEMMVLPYDSDIGLWHGDGGVLETIGLSGKYETFIAHLVHDRPRDECDDGCVFCDVWFGLTATSARLSRALVKMIKED